MIDRDLRLGLRALREGIVGPDRLCEALDECLRRGGPTLSTILGERGWASTAQLEDLERRLAEASTAGDGETGPGDGPESTGGYDGTADVSTGPAGEPTTLEGPPSKDGARRDVGQSAGGGRYELIRVHAMGGLGRVWLARDTLLGREVALKELRADRSHYARSFERFVEEARITARLEHPAIVPLYDLVDADREDSTPFYTMRFLAGRTLKAAVDAYHHRRRAGHGPAGSLELRELLDAFEAVCQAVAFAHAKEVIHRDLKGHNVILGDFGEVFVVDWGLAKPVGASRVEETPTPSGLAPTGRGETVPGSILGTPGYIAPEVLDGKPVDRRSDVYSLGAILYQILAGRPAYEGDSHHAIIRLVRERDPERPRALVRDAPRALEAVCLKAMARDPSDRYRSAGDLAAEIRRWLADEPVQAHRDPWPRRLVRWGRKHRSAVLTASAALALAFLGLILATVLIWQEQRRTAEQKVQAERERSRAEANLDLSRQLSVDLMRIADDRLSPIRGTERARAEIFDTSLKTFRSFLGQRPDDPSLRKWTAQIGRFSANVHRLLNESDVASSSYRESIALLESLAKQFPREGFYRAELALTLGDYAALVGRLGRLRESAELARRAVEVADSLVAESPTRPEGLRTLAAALYALASVEGQLGRPEESAKAARKAVALYEGLVKLQAPEANAIDPLMQGSALYALAVAERELGRLADALAVAERGLALTRPLLDRNPMDNNASHVRARFLVERGRAAVGLEGRRDEAEGDLGQAILVWDELKKRHPLVATYREWAALARQARGASKAASGRLGPALEDLDASRVALEELAKEFPDILSYRANLGRTYLELGRLARASGPAGPARQRFADAVRSLEEVIAKSPENGRDRRSLDAAREELAREGGGK